MANVCLQPGVAGCGLGVGVLHSEGQSDSGGPSSDAERDSYLLAVDAGGEEVGRYDDPTAIAIQPGCEEPSVLCAYLNQGETYVGEGIAGHAQEALSVTLLPVLEGGLEVELSRTESLVHNDGGNGNNGGDDTGGDDDGLGSGGPGVAGTSAGGGGFDNAVNGVLPNTGGVWSGLLALGLFGVGAGAFTIAYSRRRAVALV